MSETLVKKEEERPAEVAAVERTRGGQAFSPRVDILETDEELVLYGDLPGVAAETLDIQFENGVLTIHGKVDRRHGDISFLYGEYGIGDFYRTFNVSEAIDSTKITAELKNGVLKVQLPKTDAVKPRRIEVRAG
ncbi:MAG: Hsp20/alpha crystallin family protein [Pirellulales bacterium]